MTDFPTETCRSCPKQVIWTKTAAGKDMPVDAEPVAGGRVEVYRNEPGGIVRSRVIAAKHAFGRKTLRVSHFVTCPEAKTWRRKP